MRATWNGLGLFGVVYAEQFPVPGFNTIGDNTHPLLFTASAACVVWAAVELMVGQINESLALLIRYQKVSLNHLTEFRVGVEGRVSALAAKLFRGFGDPMRLAILDLLAAGEQRVTDLAATLGGGGKNETQ